MAFLRLKNSLKRENLLFSRRLMSRASSMTYSKCRAEFKMMVRYLTALGLSSPFMVSSIILIIGMTELRGVRSSWATEEKNNDLIFFYIFSVSLIWETSLHTAIICFPLLITWRYLFGFFALKILLICLIVSLSPFFTCKLTRCVHKLAIVTPCPNYIP